MLTITIQVWQETDVKQLHQPAQRITVRMAGLVAMTSMAEPAFASLDFLEMCKYDDAGDCANFEKGRRKWKQYYF